MARPLQYCPNFAPMTKKIFARQQEITAAFLEEIDKHLLDIVEGRATEMFEIRDLAQLLHIHPTHLANTVKQATGKSACYFFEEKILTIAKRMLGENTMPINAIASLLTYDPSNFTKFFKRFTGETPKNYRNRVLAQQMAQKTETVTI
ncbi:helix-turn-helix transcriptional regulator [Sediminibacterium roseum]|uniref:Helix-turn-helix transcriptional regulator n=2 Tax=Sediminibacterium roseum TaxID=1978412 RepID=A0ABX0A3C6_9BACT|nr:helix-turn-helix transcriptional regulator [Sediminibacterium roseum]